jgi:hypothetical protein
MVSGKVRPNSSCEWIEGPDRTWEAEPLVRRLLDRLQPLAKLRELAEEEGASLEVHIVGKVHGDLAPGRTDIGVVSPSYGLSADTMADLAAMGAAFDIDQYVSLDDRPNDERPAEERADSWHWGDDG